MKVLVCGSTGCVGAAVVRALRTRGHQVVEGTRRGGGAGRLQVDYLQPVAPECWAALLAPLGLDAVVNCIGVLRASAAGFDRVHARGPIELFRGAALAGIGRIVQVSALGVDDSPQSLATPYLHSKLQADDALATLPLDWAVLRPSLVYGPGSQSAALFSTLASLPAIGLPGRGAQPVQPIHVYELAEAIVRLVERRAPLRAVHEIGGPQALSYRAMLAAYREAMGLGPALWLPLPMALMQLGARLAEALPQRAFTRDTLRLLERGNVARDNAAAALLGRPPTALARGLAITPPVPALDLRVRLAPLPHAALRASIAAMWLYTALVSALLPQTSGVLQLLARCGFTGDAGIAALIFSCTLNSALGLAMLLRPLPIVHAAQIVAVLAYTGVAAVGMPELTIDHCGPLAKNLPVLAALMISWLAQPEVLRAVAARPLPVACIAVERRPR